MPQRQYGGLQRVIGCRQARQAASPAARVGLGGDRQRYWPRGVRGDRRKLFENLTGTAETLGVIPVFVLLALVLAGLVVVIVDTSRIHRADAAVRVSAKGSVSHYPLYAHAHRYPPRHHGSWVFAIVMLVAMTGLTVFLLPPK